MPIRIPLAAALGLQVLVVAAAFIAAILVLSEQQKSEFKPSLYEQLSLRQSYVLGAIRAVMGPPLSTRAPDSFRSVT